MFIYTFLLVNIQADIVFIDSKL